MIKALMLLVLFLACMGAAPVEARLFDSPQNVAYLDSEVSRDGSITLESTGPGAVASSLEIWITVPQGTARQTSQLVDVIGPDSHRFGEDDFGNEILIMVWDDPPVDTLLDYRVVFRVKVTDSDDPSMETDFPLSLLTEPTQEITEKSYEITAGLTTKQKFMELTSYVYGLVDYDDTYQNVQKSADWVFRNQRAVCDGHANLLISMLRSLGYNAYYVIGYAYTEVGVDPGDPNYWGPHGWVEVEHEGSALSMDPTWLEAPVDATHVKFAIAPDSNYTEYVQIMASNVRVDWDKGDYRVTMLDHMEEPKIGIEGRLVNQDPGSGESSVLITEVSSVDECAITELGFSSCTNDGEPFFSSVPDKKRIGFCGTEEVYWVIGAPVMEPGVDYVCGVSVTGSGARFNMSIKASYGDDFVTAFMTTPKVLTKGEFFSVNTSLENSGLGSEDLEMYMLLDDHVQEHSIELQGMAAADLTWTMRAPRREGTYRLMFFDSSGGLLEEDIEVIGTRAVEIADAGIPGSISLGEEARLNVTLIGLEDASGRVEVVLGKREGDEGFSISKGEEKTLTFVLEPKSAGSKHFSIAVLSDGGEYQDGLVGNLSVTRDIGWLESLMESIRGILESLFRALGMSG